MSKANMGDVAMLNELYILEAALLRVQGNQYVNEICGDVSPLLQNVQGKMTPLIDKIRQGLKGG